MVEVKSKGGEGEIKGDEGIGGWLRNLRVVKAKSRVVKEFECGEGILYISPTDAEGYRSHILFVFQ